MLEAGWTPALSAQYMQYQVALGGQLHDPTPVSASPPACLPARLPWLPACLPARPPACLPWLPGWLAAEGEWGGVGGGGERVGGQAEPRAMRARACLPACLPACPPTPPAHPPHPPTQDALYAFMKHLLGVARRHPDAKPFLAPVPREQVPDYYDIIIVSALALSLLSSLICFLLSLLVSFFLFSFVLLPLGCRPA